MCVFFTMSMTAVNGCPGSGLRHFLYPIKIQHPAGESKFFARFFYATATLRKNVPASAVKWLFVFFNTDRDTTYIYIYICNALQILIQVHEKTRKVAKFIGYCGTDRHSHSQKHFYNISHVHDTSVGRFFPKHRRENSRRKHTRSPFIRKCGCHECQRLIFDNGNRVR